MYRLEITLKLIGADSQMRFVIELNRKELVLSELGQTIQTALIDALSLLDMSVVSSANGSTETADRGRTQ